MSNTDDEWWNGAEVGLSNRKLKVIASHPDYSVNPDDSKIKRITRWVTQFEDEAGETFLIYYDLSIAQRYIQLKLLYKDAGGMDPKGMNTLYGTREYDPLYWDKAGTYQI